MLKTGLIQPETIPGHFPRNLRTIVELYRSCLDAGAELVLCPPLALSGVHTGELALRSGFRTQHRAALARHGLEGVAAQRRQVPVRSNGFHQLLLQRVRALVPLQGKVLASLQGEQGKKGARGCFGSRAKKADDAG